MDLFFAVSTLCIACLLLSVITWKKRRAIINHLIAKRVKRRANLFNMLNNSKVDVVFFGDSLTEGGEWHELFPDCKVANRGIGGDTTADLLARVQQVVSLTPKKVFIMAGINDLSRAISLDKIAENFEKIFNNFDTRLPTTTIYVQSVLPIRDSWYFSGNKHVPALNRWLRNQAQQRGYVFIDLHSAFCDDSQQLKVTLSNDGVHLLGEGYRLWQVKITPYVECA